MSKLASDISDSASRAVEFTGEVINDLVNVVLQAVGGVVDGANLIANTTGDVANKLVGDVIGVQTTQVFKGVGATANEIASNLGTVVAEIPLVGKPAALVVRRAGEGVFHVIASVGGAAGSGARRIGLIAKKTTDLVVFTLSSSREEIDEIGASVTQLVTKLTARSAAAAAGGRRTSRRRTARKRGGGTARRKARRKARGGLALYAPNMDKGAPFHPTWRTSGGGRPRRALSRKWR